MTFTIQTRRTTTWTQGSICTVRLWCWQLHHWLRCRCWWVCSLWIFISLHLLSSQLGRDQLRRKLMMINSGYCALWVGWYIGTWPHFGICLLKGYKWDRILECIWVNIPTWWSPVEINGYSSSLYLNIYNVLIFLKWWNSRIYTIEGTCEPLKKWLPPFTLFLQSLSTLLIP